VARARSAKRAGRLARRAPGLAALTRHDRRWLPKDVLAGVSVAALALQNLGAARLTAGWLLSIPIMTKSWRRSATSSLAVIRQREIPGRDVGKQHGD
jgi:hypothetical protein